MKRMNDDEGGMVEGEDAVLEAMIKHWEELGKKREDG